MARKATKQLVEQDFSALDAYCIGMWEFAQSLKRAGFAEDEIMGIIVERSAYPAWILPDPIEPERFGDYEDDDDED
jgi:hypothetical protein